MREGVIPTCHLRGKKEEGRAFEFARARTLGNDLHLKGVCNLNLAAHLRANEDSKDSRRGLVAVDARAREVIADVDNYERVQRQRQRRRLLGGHRAPTGRGVAASEESANEGSLMTRQMYAC